jgi:hypothetical protein
MIAFLVDKAKQIKLLLINHFEYHRVVRLLFVVEIVIILVTLIGGIIGVVNIHNRCWFGWFGREPIKSIEHYYSYVSDGQIIMFDPNDEIRVRHENILLGIKISLQKECYCPNLYAEINNYERESGKLAAGSAELRHVNGDVTVLQGEWTKPSPKEWYRLKLWFKCPDQPNVRIPHDEDFAVFYLLDEVDQ